MKTFVAFALLSLSASYLAAGSLADSIDRLIDASPAARAAFWGIEIVDLKTGRTLYEQSPARFFVPASNTKLFTTAMALTRLGPKFTFQTRVLVAALPDTSGRIAGNMVLVGGGDPNLSPRAIPYTKDPVTGNPLAAIEDLADQVAAHGVKRVDGDIVGDDTWYTWEPYGPGWGIDDPQYDYGAPVSALTVNDNTLTVHIGPGAREGNPAAILLDPPLEYYNIDNRVRTTAAGTERQIHAQRAAGSYELELWGTVPLGGRGEDLALGIEDPAQYAAMALRQALEERGITVTGRALAHHAFAGDDTVPPTGQELARRVSAPLLEDLRITDKVSQNLHAEMALRAVGRTVQSTTPSDAARQGTREAGLEELKKFLGEVGVPPEGYSIHDGSGLSRLNLVTPLAVVALLRYMYDGPQRENWMGLLPVGGQDGTLGTRFAGIGTAVRIHAKTGSLSHVAALSGYAQRANGEWVVFSILVNNFNGAAGEVRGVMDRIGALLVE
jgi:D-alanyl-D-alanine carboxypeptidase/D-alanyl-D-alanine-endopeptidase (penicillin-binding protein 4)